MVVDWAKLLATLRISSDVHGDACKDDTNDEVDTLHLLYLFVFSLTQNMQNKKENNMHDIIFGPDSSVKDDTVHTVQACALK